MSTESKHTPTPWRLKLPDSTRIVSHHREDPYEIAQALGDYDKEWEWMEGNAALIVRAVNCQEDMVKALEPFAALLQDHHEQMPDTHVLFAVNRVAITFGQLRAAVAVLARAKAAP